MICRLKGPPSYSCVFWDAKPPSRMPVDRHIFSRGSLLTLTSHCCWEGEHHNVSWICFSFIAFWCVPCCHGKPPLFVISLDLVPTKLGKSKLSTFADLTTDFESLCSVEWLTCHIPTHPTIVLLLFEGGYGGRTCVKRPRENDVQAVCLVGIFYGFYHRKSPFLHHQLGE